MISGRYLKNWNVDFNGKPTGSRVNLGIQTSVTPWWPCVLNNRPFDELSSVWTCEVVEG